MIAARAFAGKEVAVFGLARSGLATVRALKAGGARVTAWDDREAARTAAVEVGAVFAPVDKWRWVEMAALILSPGVPLTHPAPHPVVLAAREAGVPIIGDVELFARAIRPDPDVDGMAPVIAITGTNGKSTTTALIGHILSASGYNAEVGGNIGNPLLDLPPPGARTIYVIEMSSYQIDLSPGFVPDVSVLSNITPDHVDRHGSLSGYAAVKARLLAQTAKDGLAVVGVDDPQSSAIFTQVSAKGAVTPMPVSAGKVLGRGVFVLDGVLYDAQNQRATKVMDLKQAAHLPGAHNWQNAALAYAACRPFVGDARAIASAMADFPGLPHRLEDVGRIGNVVFVNDSKATNADAAERALVCYPDIFWIAGGRPKEGGIESLRPHFPRIRKAYLIGEAASQFADTLAGRVTYEVSDTLEKAVASALADASHSSAPAPVVLLSPACASFDQFRDFEARGAVFRDAVAALAVQLREAS
ncbi:MAG: UDP-N-acetylmuramoyl-L-alanine--D-glutamate ligase [Pseudomonadota bacterium]|nr:UDP-N-acetylmuramoyl-L-alanine--D-glutamate ligase [Pseudomonadota bacterium]